jgi:hypothetical protein
VRKTVTSAIAILLACALAGAEAWAQFTGGVGGGGFNPGAGAGQSINPGNIQVNSPNLPLPGFIAPESGTAPQRYRDLTVVGRTPADPATLPQGARIVRLRVDGRLIPMAIDTELGIGELTFGTDQRYARELYEAILTKRVEVVGEEQLRKRIIWSADNNAPAEIRGYVFNPLKPYMVVRSVFPPE